MDANVLEKLASVETSLKRWERRLTRATNMVSKLQKKRRRLSSQVSTEIKTLPPAPTQLKLPAPSREQELKAEVAKVMGYEPEKVTVPQAQPLQCWDKPDDLGIPNFLSRKPDEGTKIAAQRSEPADKTKMPLTGNAAKDYIRRKSIEVEKKHEKRNKRFFKAEA